MATGLYTVAHPVAKMDAEFRRATAMDILSESHEVSLRSPVRAEMPRYYKNARVVLPTAPKVSIATGSNRYVSVIAMYWVCLRASASSAADPAEMEELITDPAL